MVHIASTNHTGSKKIERLLLAPKITGSGRKSVAGAICGLYRQKQSQGLYSFVAVLLFNAPQKWFFLPYR